MVVDQLRKVEGELKRVKAEQEEELEMMQRQPQALHSHARTCAPLTFYHFREAGDPCGHSNVVTVFKELIPADQEVPGK